MRIALAFHLSSFPEGQEATLNLARKSGEPLVRDAIVSGISAGCLLAACSQSAGDPECSGGPVCWQGTFDAVPWSWDAGSFTSVTCAGVGDDLHVIVLDRFGRLAHLCYVPGADPWIFVEWMDYVIPLEVGPFTTISCAAMGGDLHLVSVAEQLWHSVKPAGGGSSWEISAPVPAGNSAELGPFGTVGCAGVGENLHVAATLAPFQ